MNEELQEREQELMELLHGMLNDGITLQKAKVNGEWRTIIALVEVLEGETIVTPIATFLEKADKIKMEEGLEPVL